MRAHAPERAPWMLSRTLGVVAISLVVALTGCTNLVSPPTSVALTEEQGFPVDAPFDEPVWDEGWRGEPVGWLSDDRSTITIVTYGSSGCTFIATAIDRIDERRVSIAFEQAPAEACTDDLAPRTHVFLTPAGLSDGAISADVSTRLSAFGEAEASVTNISLDATAARDVGAPGTIAVNTFLGLPEEVSEPEGSREDLAPIAYQDGSTELLVVTWESSTCPRPALSLESVIPNELAVYFGPVPPGPCTFDIVPVTHVFAVSAETLYATSTMTVTLELDDGTNSEYSVPIVRIVRAWE